MNEPAAVGKAKLLTIPQCDPERKNAEVVLNTKPEIKTGYLCRCLCSNPQRKTSQNIKNYRSDKISFDDDSKVEIDDRPE